MSCTGTSDCLCGCCSGISVQTPQGEDNLPGLPAVAYRTGTWATFKESMLARLSSAEYPALSGLKTRDDDDFSIALMDASSVMLDILTFYQERLANESYLRTATQLRSLTELARLIGYQPAPGVSSSVYLSFTLQAAPGSPSDPTTTAITIPMGTQVQSVPAQGQAPQTFETSADILAKADWNAMPVQSAQPWIPASGDQYVYLQGTATQLQPGDVVLIVGDDRADDPSNPHWDVRLVTTATPDTPNKRTYVEWSDGLGGGGIGPAQKNAKFYVFRQRASLFGYNAVNPQMLSKDTLSNIGGHIEAFPNPPKVNSGGSSYFVSDQVTVAGGGGVNGVLQVQATSPSPQGAVTALSVIDGGIGYSSTTKASTTGGFGTGLTVDFTASANLLNSDLSDWGFKEPGSGLIDLDAVYSKLVVGGWIALIRPNANITPSPAGFVSLYRINSITLIARSEYSISAKISRVAADTDSNLDEYYGFTRETMSLVQSEELAVAEKPLTYPLYGSVLDLKDARVDLAGIQAIAVYGKSQKLQVNTGVNSLTFKPDDASGDLPLKPGDIVTILEPTNLPPGSDGVIPDWTTLSDGLSLRVLDPSGRAGTLDSKLSDFTLVPASSNDPVIQEFALVSSISLETDPYPRTRVHLASELLNCYDRTATAVNANVGLATQGMSVSEILGSGSASTPNQKFSLKQTPLTFVQAPTPTGRLSTLEVTANGVAWTEVPSLYQQPPSAQVFSTLNQPGGNTDTLFGDLVEGSTLPRGQNNVQANYRVGAGLSGNVAAGSITTLMDRPLGVTGVNNPGAATGGQDPQSVDDVRTNAPLSVLTLGRAVSITDYQNFAQAFAGITKAYAIWIPSGPGRGVFITVAAAGGSALPPGNPTLDNLVTALHNYGNPLIPINAASFLETLFSFSADIKYDPSYDAKAVKQNVLDQLRQSYSFAVRTFGQGVSADEIAAFIQSVPGVIACNVTSLTPEQTSKAGDLSNTGWSTYAYQQWLTQQVTLDRPGASSPTRICAYLPVATTDMLPDPAEILVLDPNPDHVQLGGLA